MRKSNTLNLGTGAFVVLGFAALLFLTTQTTTRGISLGGPPHYDVIAKFDNIGDLRVGAPVSMSGVEIGRVVKIDFDTKEYKAVVQMRLSAMRSRCIWLLVSSLMAYALNDVSVATATAVSSAALIASAISISTSPTPR